MKHSEKSSTILMFVVFFLSFIVLWNVADLISKVDNQKQRRFYKNMQIRSLRNMNRW